MTRISPAEERDPAGREPAAEPVLRVLDLHKTYLSGFWRRRREALRGVSFTVGRGEVFALLGHNGAGKTTTLKCLLDLVHADAGRLEIFGRDPRDPRTRARLGYLPESPTFYEHLDGRELLDFYGRLCGLAGRERSRRVDETLALVGLRREARVRVGKYSKGMRQRIGLAQTLLHDPELLILDEPMSGLDPLGRREVRDLLGEMKRRGKTVLLSSHIVPDVEALADSVGILRQGRLRACHDLAARRTEVRFEVTLGRRPAGPAAEALLRGCAVRELGPGRPEALVTAPDLESLQRLLAICGDAAVPVRSVLSRQAELEDLFLAELAGAASGEDETPAEPAAVAGRGDGRGGAS